MTQNKKSKLLQAFEYTQERDKYIKKHINNASVIKLKKDNNSDANIKELGTELERVRDALKKINGKVFHWDDFDAGLGNFGETIMIDKYKFVCKSFVDTMFERDTVIAEAFKYHFSGFRFCVYECETKFFQSKHDIEPSITALIADDRMYIIGYSDGIEV